MLLKLTVDVGLTFCVVVTMRLVLTAVIMFVEIDVVAMLVMILVIAIVEIGGVLVIEITLQLETLTATSRLGRCSDRATMEML